MEMNTKQINALTRVILRELDKEISERRKQTISELPNYDKLCEYVKEIQATQKEIKELENRIYDLSEKMSNLGASNYQPIDSIVILNRVLANTYNIPSKEEITDFITVYAISNDINIKDLIESIKDHFLK